jgi:cytochrome c-type biogenesis protein CcmH/NrfG
MNDDFLERTPVRALFDIPTALIDQARAMAYECHLAGRHEQAELLCRGLLAVDHRCWWTYSLYAATLRDTGRPAQALELVQQGLRYEPAQATLRALEAELEAAQAPAVTPSDAALPEAA